MPFVVTFCIFVLVDRVYICVAWWSYSPQKLQKLDKNFKILPRKYFSKAGEKNYIIIMNFFRTVSLGQREMIGPQLYAIF